MRIDLPERVRSGLLGQYRYKGIHGGRASAKSRSAAQWLVLGMYLHGSNSSVHPGYHRVLCAREIQLSISTSSFRLVKDTIERLEPTWRGRPFFSWTQNEIRGLNGSWCGFKGLRTNAESIPSFEGLDAIWLEEARRVSENSLRLIRPTLRSEHSEIMATWNPVDPDDPIDDLFRGPAGAPPRSWVCELNWWDNPWMPQVSREEMEWDRRRDAELAAHVWDGEYYHRSNEKVFRNWTVEDFELPPEVRRMAGADWGFGETDPTCAVVISIVGKKIYVEHEAWGLKCPWPEIPALLAGTDERGRWSNPRNLPGIPGIMGMTIRADSNQPGIIRNLQGLGFSITGAVKGSGSVLEGVNFLQGHDIVVHPRCIRVQDEMKRYRYKKDPRTDEVLPELVDDHNHLIDSLRYASESYRNVNRVF